MLGGRNKHLPHQIEIEVCYLTVKTTSWTGGLHSPYKGLLQASSLKGTTEIYYRITRTTTRKRVPK